MTNRGQGEVTAAVPGFGRTTRAVRDSSDIVADVALTVFHPSATSVEAGFFTWDISSGEVICDPVTLRMHGLVRRAGRDHGHVPRRVPDSDLSQVQEAMRKMVATAGTYQIEYRVRGEDGGLRWMEARGRVMPGPDGEPARMMGLVMDTTAVREQREAEERQLRELANRASRARDFTAALASASTVEAIIEAASDGLHAYSADGLILMALPGRPASGRRLVRLRRGQRARAERPRSGATDPAFGRDPMALPRLPALAGKPGRRLPAPGRDRWVIRRSGPGPRFRSSIRPARSAAACSASPSPATSPLTSAPCSSPRLACSASRWSGRGCTRRSTRWRPSCSAACCRAAR